MFLPRANRKIIPRWRDFWTTAALGQLTPASVNSPKSALPSASEIEAHEAWHIKPTLWHALDLVGAAFVIGDLADPDVISAAKFLEGRGEDCPSPARLLVSRILHGDEDKADFNEASHVSNADIKVDIHFKRRRLNEEPRNSILWTDVARLYTSLGQQEKALHAIQMSWNLAPDNRFVVRSVARFLVHIGDNERALRVLRATELNQSDPWVVAAEIGVSSFSNKDPRLLKLGRRMVDSPDFSEFAKSELASAIATFELNEGNRRSAKKLFKQSLALPTENSVAQAEWASGQVGDLHLPPDNRNVPRNYEARSLHGFRVGDWETALVNAEGWLYDQPFSSRPAGVVSYLYSTILERYQDAAGILRSSLVSNPGDRGLSNNLAFALINLGHLEEAESLLNRVDPRAADDLSTITLIATGGLLAYRKGFPEIGRNLYLDAIDLAKRKSNSHYSAMAALHLAIEEIRADTESKALSLKIADELALPVDEPDVQYVHRRLKAMAAAAKLVVE